MKASHRYVSVVVDWGINLKIVFTVYSQRRRPERLNRPLKLLEVIRTNILTNQTTQTSENGCWSQKGKGQFSLDEVVDLNSLVSSLILILEQLR